MTPDVIVASFRDVIAQSRPVIMAGVGSGLTAAGAARGGAHLIAAYSTAVYRCRGLPSVLSFLPYDNANDLAFSVAADVIAQAGDCPVILGLGVHDPRGSRPCCWCEGLARAGPVDFDRGGFLAPPFCRQKGGRSNVPGYRFTS